MKTVWSQEFKKHKSLIGGAEWKSMLDFCVLHSVMLGMKFTILCFGVHFGAIGNCKNMQSIDYFFSWQAPLYRQCLFLYIEQYIKRTLFLKMWCGYFLCILPSKHSIAVWSGANWPRMYKYKKAHVNCVYIYIYVFMAQRLYVFLFFRKNVDIFCLIYCSCMKVTLVEHFCWILETRMENKEFDLENYLVFCLTL